jgi:hypothetical protein
VKRWISALALSACIAGCSKHEPPAPAAPPAASATVTASAPLAPSATPSAAASSVASSGALPSPSASAAASTEPPTEEDFEDEANQKVTPDTLDSQLDALEKEIQAD